MATTGQRIPKVTGLSASIVEERRALLQRVLWSRQIEKSARIRDFLVYVCERALREPSVEIHEQEIGYRVFGRAADYDTTADNIVRVTASQARKKIEQYFASEGVSEPVILEIPKGHYVPIFRERDVASAETASALEPSGRHWYWRAVVVLAACAPLLAVVAGWSLVKLRSERLAARAELDASPALNALWSQLLLRAAESKANSGSLMWAFSSGWRSITSVSWAASLAISAALICSKGFPFISVRDGEYSQWSLNRIRRRCRAAHGRCWWTAASFCGWDSEGWRP